MLENYKVELKNMNADICSYEYQLDSQFFCDVESSDIQTGNLNVSLTVKKTSSYFQMDFEIDGTVVVTCDRCLEDMMLPIETSDSLKVKLGEEFSDDDDMVVIPEEDGYINVAWFMYEFIALNIPLKHIHEVGECNEEMVSKLNKHLRTLSDEDEEDFDDRINEETKEIDPRWNELKKILDNN